MMSNVGSRKEAAVIPIEHFTAHTEFRRRRKGVVAIGRIGVEREIVDGEAHQWLDSMRSRFADREAGADQRLDSRVRRLVDVGRQAVAGSRRVIDRENLIANTGVVGSDVPMPQSTLRDGLLAADTHLRHGTVHGVE